MGGVVIQGKAYKIEIVSEDAQSTTDGAASAANKLAYEDKVKYCMNAWGFESGAANPILAANKIINWNNYPTYTPGEVADQYAFTSNVGKIGFGFLCAQAVKKYWPEVKTVVNMVNDTGTMDIVSKYVLPYEQSLGLEPMGPIIGLSQNQMDLTTLADKLNQQNPDAFLMLDAYPQQSKSFVKELRLLGNHKPFILPATEGASDFLKILGPTATNVWVTGTYPGSPFNPPLIAKLQAKMGPDIGLQMSHTQGLCILVWAMKQADSLDPLIIAKTIEKSTETKFEDTLYGKVTFCGTLVYSAHDEFGNLLENHGIGMQLPTQMIMDGKIIDSGWLDSGNIP